ncbi:hypothetical protein GCM10027456_80810 [Kineosporia babensis]
MPGREDECGGIRSPGRKNLCLTSGLQAGSGEIHEFHPSPHRSLAAELRGSGARVVLAHPGATANAFFDESNRVHPRESQPSGTGHEVRRLPHWRTAPRPRVGQPKKWA